MNPEPIYSCQRSIRGVRGQAMRTVRFTHLLALAGDETISSSSGSAKPIVIRVLCIRLLVENRPTRRDVIMYLGMWRYATLRRLTQSAPSWVLSLLNVER